MKICNSCNESKNLESFFKDKNNKTDGRYSICKACKKIATLKWRAENPDKYNKAQRDYMKAMCPEKRYGIEIKRRYGCTLEQYNQMLIKQEGKCEICSKLHNPAEKKGRLFVDHCHKTGAVRALLCSACNSMLGYAQDDTRVLMQAVTYIARFRTKEPSVKETHEMGVDS